jgi:predicted Zn-dependent peptidase
MSGDLTESQARALVEKHFGAWTGTAAQPPAPGAAAPLSERTFVVDRPGSGQTKVLLAQPGVPLHDPDHLKLELLNTVLGSPITGRLDRNLRERHGYTYGATSSVSSGRYDGEIVLDANVKTEFTGATVREIRAEVAGLRDSPVTDEELRQAKDSLTRSLPAGFATSTGTANAVAGLYLNDQPTDYYQTLPSQVEAITAEDLQAVARAHLRPEELKVVVVGDRAQIEPQLTESDPGPIAHRTVDATPERS